MTPVRHTTLGCPTWRITATNSLPFTDRALALEALRRSQYKFPGRQKIIISKNWGFTPLRRDEYLEKKAAGRVKDDGAYVQFLSNHGSLAENIRRFPGAFTA